MNITETGYGSRDMPLLSMSQGLVQRPRPARFQRWVLAVSVGTLALFGGCGGGGGGTTSPAPVVQGTAAVGKPVVNGSLSLLCVSGGSTNTTGTDGRFKIDATKITFPCLMVVSGGTVDGVASGWTLVSAVTKAGVANVSPVTHLVLARLLGSDPNAVTANLSAPDLQMKLTDANLATAKEAVRTELGRLLGAAPPADLDPLTTAFEATTADGMDALIATVMNGLLWTAKTLTQAALEIAAGALQVKEVPGNCRPAVLTGFAGKFDDVVVQVPYDPNRAAGDGGTGGDAAGSGGGDGAGTGGSLGQFVNALVRVERNDGSLLGQAVTDSDKGLVTIVPCRYQGALHISVRAKPDGSTQYYEESTRQYVAFPVGTVINAVVPNLDKNVGITVLTEAAWNYLGAKYGADGWKTTAHITEASEAVRKEFNRFLPLRMQIEDITRLPVLLNDKTPNNTIDATKNGIYGVVNSGLARAAGLLRVGDASAALRIVQQMGADLCDGLIDGKCNGKPVVGDSSELAYLVPQLAEFLNTGVGDIATNCGTAATEIGSLRVVQMKVNGSAQGAYTDTTPIWLLRNDGQLFYWLDRNTAPVPYATGLRFRQLMASGPLLGVDTQGVAYLNPARNRFVTPVDVSVAPVPVPSYRGVSSVAAHDPTKADQHFLQVSRLEDGQAYVADPAITQNNIDITRPPTAVGLRSVVRLGVGIPGAYYAVTSDGSLFSWGTNFGGQLGLGLTETQQPSVSAPTLVRFPGGTSMASVSGHWDGAFAIDSSGSIWGWGNLYEAEAVLPAETPTPVKILSLEQYGPFSQIECGDFGVCLSLTRTGDLVGWGRFLCSGCGLSAPTKVQLGGRKAVFVGESGVIVYAVLDDGSLALFRNGPSAPSIVAPGILGASAGGTCQGSRP